MKNLTLFPLSRNLYFPGKQLVTRDMEAEQRYFNNKRRLLNSLLHGSGIVCGLGVTAVEENSPVSGSASSIGMSVAVEPGLAIDGTGREIVVPEQVYLRLSDLDGFSADSGLADYVYLCIEYAETEREPMHSILDSAVADDNYNRVEETCRFYLTYSEPVGAAPMPAAEEYENMDRLRQEYYGENLEKRLEKIWDEKICLAKINMVRWGAAYSIGSVKTVPFGQYVMSAALAAAICANSIRLLQTAGSNFDPGWESRGEPAALPAGAQPEPLLRQGLLPVDIPDNLKPGGVVFSEDIPHSLGVGMVSMSVGLVAAGGVVYGARSIFREAEGYEYAVKTDESAGTFKVGVRVLTPQPGGRIMFSWLAVRDPAEVGEALPQPQLVISPGTLRLPLRGTAHFSYLVYGISVTDVTWSVREPEGGNIGADGFYRAPNNPGVYEITARSSERPGLRASAFVVVYEQ